MITKRDGTLGMIAFLTLNALAACSDAPRNELTAPLAPPLASASNKGATTTTTNEFISPFGFDTMGECGLEIVSFSGILHAVAHTTITSTGGIHSFVHFGPVGGVTGVGLSSGAKYELPGMAHGNVNVNGAGAAATETFINNFQIIGQGKLPNRNFQVTFHITVNANGEVTVAFDRVREKCG